MRKTWMAIGGIVLSCVLTGTALAGADGASVYKRCFACHKSNGEGTSGFYPPLAGHAPKLLSADRTYMVRVILYGLKGEIDVEGKTYKTKMRAFADKLKDDEIAAVLNYVLASWGNSKMLPEGHKEFTAAEVKALRGKRLTAEQVYEERQKLNL
ncbi:MAG: cytochrome c [Candidatus Deferrimicrobiaceae bacterium]